MKKKIIFSVLIISILLTAAGCQKQENIIGLRRLEYEPEKSVLFVYYFPTRSQAESYFNEQNQQDYFLFEVHSQDARKFFQELKGEKLEENKKRLVYTRDENSNAIDKVIKLIDENNMLRIAGPN